MRTLPLFALTAVLSTPLFAQGNPADPDKKVMGGGTVPAGWSYRLDDTTASVANVKFVPMGNGLHFTTGPAGIYWQDADAVTGSFHTIATFVQTKFPSSGHREAYGLFIMGNDLKGPNQSYIYFVVAGTGQYTIRQRQGGNVTNVSQGDRNGWAANPAVVKQDSTTGKATNLLEISADATSKKITFKVNGKVVHEMNATGGTVGVVGIRMNHNLDVHIDGFAVHKM